MRKMLVKWALGSALKSVNKFLLDNSENVSLVREKTTLWLSRVEKACALLQKANASLEDGKLEIEEIKSLVEEARSHVKAW